MAQSRISRAWNDLLPAATISRSGPSAAAFTQYGTTGFYFATLADNHGADEQYQSGFQLSHAWAAGTEAHVHIHVIPSANGAAGNEDVVLKLEYQWVNINAAFSTTTNSTETLTFRVGAADANKHILWEWTAINGTGKTLSSALPVLITRLSKTSAADNYTGDIKLVFVDAHVEHDRLGSVAEVTD